MRNRGKVSLLTLLAVLVPLVLLLSLVDFGAMGAATEGARRSSCGINTHQIGLSILQYAGDHGDNSPATFGELLKEGYLATPKVFICPSNWERVPGDFPPDDQLRSADLKDLNRVAEFGSYVLERGSRRDRPPDWLVVHDKDGAHNGLGRNVFCNNGAALWLGEGEFLVRMQQQKAVRRGLEPPPLAPSRDYVGRRDDVSMSLANWIAAVIFVALPIVGLVWLVARQKRFNVVMGWRSGLAILIYAAAIPAWLCLGGWIEESRQRHIARENTIRLVGFAMMRHAWDHDGAYPDKVSVLLDHGYITRPGVLLDNGGRSRTGRPYAVEVLRSADESGSYALAGVAAYARRPDVIVLYERTGWGRRNCYFDDGHVEQVTTDEIRERLAAQEAKPGVPREKLVE